MNFYSQWVSLPSERPFFILLWVTPAITNKDITQITNRIMNRIMKSNFEIFDKYGNELHIADVKSLPNDEEVKAYIDTLPYYGTCTTECNEGFEDGIKWLKGQMSK